MIDVTDATFQTEVIERSATTPVVLDLWAPWCGPCRTLGPMLEKVVGETNGRVVLAKVNVDENPQISAAFRVQSIPAVYGIANGQPVDGFMGAQPEAELRQFVNKLLVGDLGPELEALVQAGDEASLRRALELDPTYEPAALTLAQLLLGSDQAAEALAVLEPFAGSEMADQLAELAREAALSSDAKGSIEARLAELLDTVKVDDEHRQEFVALLEDLTVGDPSGAAEWRKKLSTRLF